MAQTQRQKETYYCLFCKTPFNPARRFVQKYCSESCRVMSCNARKHGLRGTYESDKQLTKITNKALFERINATSDYASKHDEFNDLRYKNVMSKLDNIAKHITYIELGGIAKIIYDWWQNVQRKETERERDAATQEMKNMVSSMFKQSPDIKKAMEDMKKTNPVMNDILSGIL